MKLTRYDSAAEFLKRARAPLEQEEAANSLIVGIPARVAEQPGFYWRRTRSISRRSRKAINSSRPPSAPHPTT